MPAKLYWWPKALGAVQEIDLGECLSDLQRTVMVEQVAIESISGVETVNRFSARSRLRVIQERFTDATLARKLRTLENYMQRGGVVGLAEDSDKAVAGFLNLPLPDRGATSLQLSGLPFPYNPSAALDIGDPVVLQSPSPEYLYEETAAGVALPAGSTSATVEAIELDYTLQRWALFRHRGFWPLLRVPLAARTNTFLTHDHRISWTFDVPLEEVLPAIDKLSESPNQPPLSTDGFAQLGWSPGNLGGNALDEDSQDIISRMGAAGS